MTEEAYPYVGKKFFKKCKYEEGQGVGKVADYTDVPSKQTDQLQAALAKGPVSVAVEADKSAFQMYSGGVLDTAACGQKLDHGVLAVGYGTENGTDYILVKNSWGASWGDQGYVKIAPSQCGITNSASYPTE